MSTKVLKIYGLQRTKTNYLQKFLELNYDDILVLSNLSGWKHGFVKETIDWSGNDWEENADISKQYYYENLKECNKKEKIINEAFKNNEVKYFFTFRNPYSTYVSRKKHYSDKEQFMKDFVSDWNLKNSHYVDFIKNNPAKSYKLKFEDFIDPNKNNIFLDISSHFGLKKGNPEFLDFKKRIDPRMRETNATFVEPSEQKVSLIEKEYFHKNLNMSLMNELGYEL
jgi:hypothetical protein